MQNGQSDDFDPYRLLNRLRDEAWANEHPPYLALYRPNGTVPRSKRERGHSPSRTFTEIAPVRGSYRRGKPCRLVKARHLIRMSGGNDIQPGQICVAVETAGIGEGRLYEGIHAVRVRLPDSDVRRLTVARVDIIGRALRWDDRKDVRLSPDEYEIVGNVIGCYSSDRRSAPILTMMSN